MSNIPESQQGGLRKALIVGCGGSGDATLAFMMDQLRSILAREGIARIPAGWQFVEIDVPLAAERRDDGLANVQQAGGTYLGLGIRNGHYHTLDKFVSDRLGSQGALQELATWAPRDPQDPSLPGVTEGAGQVRAVGRMVTLNGVKKIQDVISNAIEKMNSNQANQEMEALDALGGHKSGAEPIVIVVSSMAGGAGASMALDVCRILSRINGVPNGKTALFMVGADAFNQLPEHARSGVRANALAKLGEIVACQAGAGVEDDQRLYHALEGEGGRDAFSQIPFTRVFPIGATIATVNGAARFGDGRMDTIYRGLGVGLASLLTSAAALDQFVSYDFANTSGLSGEPSAFGWGADQSSLEWGSFGFASLSMGRDRYAEYSAQCLARGAVNRLVAGHVEPTSTAQPQEQAEALVSQLFNHFLGDLRMWDPSMSWSDWLQSELWPVHEPRSYAAPAFGTAAAIVDNEFGRYIPDGEGMRSSDWSSQIRRLLADRAPQLEAAARTASHRFVHGYHQALFSNFMHAIEQAISRHGLVYVSTLLQRLQTYLIQLSQEAGRFAATAGGPAIGALNPTTESSLSGKNAMSNTSLLKERILNDVKNGVWGRLMLGAAGALETLIPEFSSGVVRRLQQEVENRLKMVREEMAGTTTTTGLAYAVHDHYAAWPERGGQVPTRFTQADNEILLTSVADYPAAFSANLRGAFGGDVMTEYDAASKAETATISGQWEPSGGVQSPGGLIETLRRWVPGTLGVDPNTGDPLVSADASFRVSADVPDIGGRARLFIARPGASFHTFCQESLLSFVKAEGEPEHEIAARKRRMADAFSGTLQRALPLSQPNRAMVQEIYHQQPGYLFKFSAIPFLGQQDVAALLNNIIAHGVLSGQTNVDNVQQNFTRSLSTNSNIRSIEVFGSYPRLVPICFQSVLDPIAEQWSASGTENSRKAFWTGRRARPLTGSLAMGTAERQAMIQGWYLGQITGLIRVPQPPYVTEPGPVRIWDMEREQWASFPHPLLTPPIRFVDKIDWLPAILESSLLAMAQAGARPVMSSMRPYHLLREMSGLDRNPNMSSDFYTEGYIALWRWMYAKPGLPEDLSHIAKGAPMGTPEERAAAASAYCDQVSATIRVGFLTDPAPTMGRQVANYHRVTDRRVAGAMPLMRDLAEDIEDVVVPRVRALVARALAQGDDPLGENTSFGAGGAQKSPTSRSFGDDGDEVMTFGML